MHTVEGTGLTGSLVSSDLTEITKDRTRMKSAKKLNKNEGHPVNQKTKGKQRKTVLRDNWKRFLNDSRRKRGFFNGGWATARLQVRLVQLLKRLRMGVPWSRCVIVPWYGITYKSVHAIALMNLGEW